MENELGTKKINSLLISYGIPAIASSLITSVYNLIDQIFIGQKIGYLGNAATQVVYPVTILCGALALLFGIGGSVLFNIMQGKGNKDLAMRFAGSGIYLLSIAGIGAGVFIALTAPFLVGILGATGEVAPYALTYLRIIDIGIPFVIFTTGGTLLIRSDGSPKFSLCCTLTGVIINVILDYIFIFPMDMGIKGAALATIIGQIIVFVMVIWYFRRFKSGKFERSIIRFDRDNAKKIMGIGAAGSLNQATMLLAQVVINNLLKIYGEMSIYGGSEVLAAAGVVTKVNMIFYCIMLGLSIGGEPIAGFNYGAKKYGRVKEVYFKTLAFVLIVGIIETAAFWICPDALLSVFGEGTAGYHEFAIKYMHVFMLFVALSGVPAISMNILSSIGLGKKGVIISLTKQIVLLLAAIILSFIFQLNGVLYAGITADILAAIASYVILKPEFKKMNE